MTEHLVAHDVVEAIEEHDHVRHQFRLVLLHEFVEQREHVLEQQLLLLLEDVLQLFGELVEQVDAGTGQGVYNPVAEELQ
jgi:hypothetical protein